MLIEQCHYFLNKNRIKSVHKTLIITHILHFNYFVSFCIADLKLLIQYLQKFLR